MAQTDDSLADRCRDDGEFRLAARYWTGGLRLTSGEALTGFTVKDGEITDAVPEPGPGVVSLTAEPEVWSAMAEPVPERFFHDLTAAVGSTVTRGGDELTWWQYAPALQRAVELLGTREPVAAVTAADRGELPRHDSPVGRYVHVELGGTDHRLYYEEAGTGIPLLLQHTAGSHGTQWRHLFEHDAITSRFRLVAYDLPFHGKSVPPVGERWWTEEYRLDGEFLRSVPLQLAAALDLDRPAFMGCSVGGLLALDLAARHPDAFRAVISLEGALRIGGEPTRLVGFHHPQVSNETKARMMQALTSPTSPDAYRKETIQTYAAGWPPAFLGDLWYYLVDYDLTDLAAEIDTERIGVHILSGEYDTSGTVELGQQAAAAIPGSTFAEMRGVGHFPMSENPDEFVAYLIPVLDSIAERDPT